MKVAFVGMGSIGKRHLRNLNSILEVRKEPLIVDCYRSGHGAGETVPGINKTFSVDDIDESDEQYDAVFITNPSFLHLETLIRFLEHGDCFFVEKPVFDSFVIEEDVLNTINRKCVYVACPLRYNPVIDYLKKNIDITSVLSIRAICSSYLPDWRPGTDYRECYSAHKEMGGGAELDLVHEWDYLTLLFGAPKCGYSIISKKSNLEISSNDIAIYIAETDGMTIELHLDYFGRENRRLLEILTREDTILCDINKGEITFIKEGKTIHFPDERNKYQMKEMEHFIDIAEGIIENDSTVNNAINVLKYAKGVFK